ncbi:hypothetical protein BGX26_008265 [Mortierella sp. AD094]|nr:hypothetical protein BGX26_008265 [Mortierella sp. AD094]
MVGHGMKLRSDAQAIFDTAGYTEKFRLTRERSRLNLYCGDPPPDPSAPIWANVRVPIPPSSEASRRTLMDKVRTQITGLQKKLQTQGTEATNILSGKGPRTKLSLPGTSKFSISPAPENNAVVSAKRPQSNQKLPAVTQSRISSAPESEVGTSSENTSTKRSLPGSFSFKVTTASAFQQHGKRRRTDNGSNADKDSQ